MQRPRASVKHLLEDKAEALLRCELWPIPIDQLVRLLAVGAAYSLDGRRNLVVKGCARRLLRRYTMLSLTCFPVKSSSKGSRDWLRVTRGQPRGR